MATHGRLARTVAPTHSTNHSNDVSVRKMFLTTSKRSKPKFARARIGRRILLSGGCDGVIKDFLGGPSKRRSTHR